LGRRVTKKTFSARVFLGLAPASLQLQFWVSLQKG
jgi:hypothetical protein